MTPRRGLRLAPLDRLSWQDAGYLRRESAAQPMHFVLLGVIQPSPAGAAVGLRQVREHLAGRLDRAPALRRKVRVAPWGIGPMVWVDDRDFVLDRHVRAWNAELRDDADRAAALGQLAAERLDRSRPLWELLVADPRPDGATPFALATHHAMADGGLMIGLLNDLFGPRLEAGPVAEWRPAPGPAATRLLAIGLRERLRDRLGLGSKRRPGPPGPAAAEPPGTARLAGPVSPGRSIAFLTLALADLRRLRQVTGATINDVFLTVVAHGLHEYLVAVGDHALDEALLAMVPRSVRAADEARATGNRTWSMFVPLPVGEMSPGARLTAVQAATAVAKDAQRSAGTAGFRFDVAVSNVRFGGDHSVAGCAIDGYHAAVPLQGENRLIAMGLSYEANFTITFTADAKGFGDPALLAQLTARAVDALLAETTAEQP